MTRLRARHRALVLATNAGPYRVFRYRGQWLPVSQLLRQPLEPAYLVTLGARFGIDPAEIEVLRVDVLPDDFETNAVPRPAPTPEERRALALAAVRALDPAALPPNALPLVVRGLQALIGR